jgi:hypothetical protein
MAFTQDDLTALEAAIAAGTQRVRRPDGGEVQYSTMGEMLKARNVIQQALDAAAGTAARNRRAVSVYSRT